MTQVDRLMLREFYTTACHGANDDVRRAARISLEALLHDTGVTMRDAFEENGMCIYSYFASRPR
jgi:hypothetical protein